MAISQIQAASANTTSATITSTLAGDLILVFAYRNSSTTAPSLPAGYTNILTNTSGTLESCRVGYKISAGGDTSSGTWTNATNVVCLVYRGARTVGASASTQGSSTTVSYPTITLQDTSGKSWVAGMAGAKSATAGMTGTTTNLTANRTNQTTVNGLDTNGGVTSFAAQSLTVTTSGSWIGASVELRATPPYEEDTHWLRQLTAVIAIAGVMTFPAFERFQGSVSQQVQFQTIFDEDLWQNPVPSATWQQNEFPQPWTFEQNEFPTATAPTFTPDEDFWDSQVPSATWQTFVQLPTVETDFLQPPISFGLDEDYWQNPVAPTLYALLYPQQFFFEQSESPTLSGQPDEDFPGPLPAPQQLAMRPFSPNDVEEIPAGFLHGQPDEDFWQNPVASITWPNLAPDPSKFEQHESAGNLHGQPDEDFWANPAAPVVWPNAYPAPWSFEQNESPTLYGQPDEDFWSNPSQPALWSALNYPQPWTFDEEIPAGALAGQPDEDFWVNPVRPDPGSMYQRLPLLFDPSETVPSTTINPDEYFWQDPVAPVVWPNTWPAPWSFEQNEQASGLYGVPIDEPWLNPVLPSIATQFVLPFPAIDPDFVGYTPEEISTSPAVSPAIAALQVPNPWFDQGETIVQPAALDDGSGFAAPPPSIFAQAVPSPWFDQGEGLTLPLDDGTGFTVPPPQVIAQTVPTPWFDQGEVTLYVIDEAFWIPPAQWPNPLVYPPQWSFSLEERPTPGQPPEDYWQNPTAPVTYGHIWPQQFTFDTQDVIGRRWMLCFDILNTPVMVSDEGYVDAPAMESFAFTGQSKMFCEEGQASEPAMVSEGLISTPQMITLGGSTQQL